MKTKSGHSTVRTAIVHVFFLLGAAAGLQAAPFAYITESGANNVKVIDTADHSVVADIPVGRGPRAVAINAAGTRAYVTNYADRTVSAIDTAANRVIATIPVGGLPLGVVVNPAGTRVYVSSIGESFAEGRVLVLDASTNTLVSSIDVGASPLGLAMSPDGTLLYVARVVDKDILVLDTATHRRVATIALEVAPQWGLALDATGSRIYVTLPGIPALVVIDASTHAIIGSIRRGMGSPAGVALNPAGTRAYVPDGGDAFQDFDWHAVHVIDTASLAIVESVPIGASPLGVSVHPSGSRVYVTSASSDTVTVIDAATNAVTDTIAVGREPISFGKFIGPASMALAADNYQGLWWKSPAGSESGWGVNLAHQGDTLFATWFTYDADGRGLWLVMPNGARTGAGTYSGTLLRTTGPAFNAIPWNASAVTSTAVGSATFTFVDCDNGRFTYTVNGRTQSKPITRQVFSSPVPRCNAPGSVGATPTYQDLWWHSPAGSESGWGVNLAHQGDVLFATWFTYDASGKGQWLVMSNGARIDGNWYAGTLYRTTGPPFDADPWNPALVATTEVGTASFVFSDSRNATFSYTLDGVGQSRAITRQVFSAPAAVSR